MSAPVRMEDTAAYKAAIAAIEQMVDRTDVGAPKRIARKVLEGRATHPEGPFVTPLTREFCAIHDPQVGLDRIRTHIVAIERHRSRHDRWQIRACKIALRWRRRFEARLAGGNVVRLADRRAA